MFNDTLSLSLSYFTSISCHFTLNKFFVFKLKKMITLKKISRYVVVCFINYLITIITLFNVNIFFQNIYFVAFLSLIFTTTISYFLNRNWVFKYF
jgi:putative flippase GtrA